MDWLSVFEKFDDLDNQQKIELFNAIKSTLFPENNTPIDGLVSELREARFSEGVSCPHCQSTSLKRNGRYRSRQRYLCKNCNKTFNDLTASPISGTRYPHKWLRYFEYMVEGLSLPKIAKLMKIHVSTAFYWRHKILIAIQKLGNEPLTGIVESDETFFLESQKGKKVEHRKPRKRGGSSKYRGISHEQVCVVVAIDRSNNVVSEVAGNGRISSKVLDRVLGGYISKASSLCTDSARNYKKFAKDKGLEHHAINANKGIYSKKGIYHVQHVNAYHSRLKIWMDRFQGVATKYLNHYLYWFRFLEYVKKLSSSEKRKTMLIHACCEVSKTTINSFRQAS